MVTCDMKNCHMLLLVINVNSTGICAGVALLSFINDQIKDVSNSSIE